MKKTILIILCLITSSCGSLIPGGIGGGESNSNFDASTSQLQAQAGLSFARNNANTSNYRNSNIKSKDDTYNNDTNIRHNNKRNTLNIADNVLDINSNISETTSLTKNNNREVTYSAESIIFNCTESIIDKLSKIINNGFQLILMMISYSIGIEVSKRRQKKANK
ncbi:hypothetical protein [Francisella hispaniensis]|uniref:hypothetical protein n=1 Tax=Francisella hispaniensis TaxID=622488 RepID=UPI0012E73531|nr:hypothetical protein [Francisella hispaniensis]MBK2357792.1 hypothetical protein [Francisella hispaniensis]